MRVLVIGAAGKILLARPRDSDVDNAVELQVE